jgi:hypothetical protein
LFAGIGKHTPATRRASKGRFCASVNLHIFTGKLCKIEKSLKILVKYCSFFIRSTLLDTKIPLKVVKVVKVVKVAIKKQPSKSCEGLIVVKVVNLAEE